MKVKIDIVNIIGKWFDLNEQGQDIKAQEIAQAKQLDDFEPKLKNCSTFGQVKTAFKSIHKDLYKGFIIKFLAKNKISLKGMKIGDKTYNFKIEDCMKDAPTLKKEYNAEVSEYFRSNSKPLGFMRNLDTNIKDKWGELRADLKAVNPTETETIEVEVTKVTLKAFEQVAKAITQQYKTIGNKGKSSDAKVSPQESIVAQAKLKKLAKEFLEMDKSKYTFEDIQKML
tara:strand:+ start:136 stop:816 length:681 start_codon:yes stop_codon:yes gene_type:complete